MKKLKCWLCKGKLLLKNTTITWGKKTIPVRVNGDLDIRNIKYRKVERWFHFCTECWSVK